MDYILCNDFRAALSTNALRDHGSSFDVSLMYNLLVKYSALLIDKLRSIDDIRTYRDLVLRLEATAGDAALDPEFQRLYRRYWRMNVARLSGEFYQRYFDLLRRSVRSGPPELRSTVLDLMESDTSRTGSLQFSFVTKLAHMGDRTLPVYDSFIAAFYFYEAPAFGQPVESRLNALIEFHRFLCAEYERIIDEGLLDPAMKRLRAEFGLSELISDQRAIDWLLWAWVSVLRGGALQQGAVAYG